MSEWDIIEYIEQHEDGLRDDILARMSLPEEWLFLQDDFLLAELIAQVCEGLRLDWEEVAATITPEMVRDIFSL